MLTAALASPCCSSAAHAGPGGQPSGGQGRLAQVINITTALLLGVLWTRVPLHQTTTFDRQTGLARTETAGCGAAITPTPLRIVAVVSRQLPRLRTPALTSGSPPRAARPAAALSRRPARGVSRARPGGGLAGRPFIIELTSAGSRA
jgi:hypothetical protein